MNNTTQQSFYIKSKDELFAFILQNLKSILKYYNYLHTYESWCEYNPTLKTGFTKNEFDTLRASAFFSYKKDLDDFYNQKMKNRINNNIKFKLCSK